MSKLRQPPFFEVITDNLCTSTASAHNIIDSFKPNLKGKTATEWSKRVKKLWYCRLNILRTRPEIPAWKWRHQWHHTPSDVFFLFYFIYFFIFLFFYQDWLTASHSNSTPDLKQWISWKSTRWKFRFWNAVAIYFAISCREKCTGLQIGMKHAHQPRKWRLWC